MGSILMVWKRLVKKEIQYLRFDEKRRFPNTNEVKPMYPWLESTLYIDIQAKKPDHFCQRCGGCCYGPGENCLRCERRAP